MSDTLLPFFRSSGSFTSTFRIFMRYGGSSIWSSGYDWEVFSWVPDLFVWWLINIDFLYTSPRYDFRCAMTRFLSFLYSLLQEFWIQDSCSPCSSKFFGRVELGTTIALFAKNQVIIIRGSKELSIRAQSYCVCHFSDKFSYHHYPLAATIVPGSMSC